MTKDYSTESNVSLDDATRTVIQAPNKGFEIVNIHWAQLENNFKFTDNRAVRFDGQQIVLESWDLKCSEPISVEPGSIWRIKSRSTDFSDWPTLLRGVFVDHDRRFIGLIPVDDDDPGSGISTFIVPDGAAAMIVNARQHKTNQDQTHIMKLCNWENIWDKEVYGYSFGYYINQDGVVTPTTLKLAVTGDIPVKQGEIYRIANVHTGKGVSFVDRGVFLDDDDNVVGQIPSNEGGSLPYPYNDVIVPEGATKMRVNFYYEMQSRIDTSSSLSINRAGATQPIYCSQMRPLKNKVWAAYGSSTTYYSDWIRMVENATGLNAFIHGYGGASANNRGENDNYLARDDRIEQLMDCNPDIVTIQTGGNWGDSRLGDERDFEVDMGREDRTTFYGAFAYILKKIYSLKRDVLILIVEPTFSYYGYNAKSGFQTLERAKAVRVIADYFGLTIAPTRSIGANSHTNELIFADNVHLSMKGATAMAGIVLHELKQLVWHFA